MGPAIKETSESGYLNLHSSSIQKSKEVSVKKQVLIVCAIVMFLFCLTSTASMASDKCIIWGYMWTDSMTDYTYIHTWLYENGTFATEQGTFGIWEKFGGAFKLQYTDGCQPLFPAPRSKVFLNVQQVLDPGELYTIKGTNQKNCD